MTTFDTLGAALQAGRVAPFRIAVDQAVLDDLRDRIARTRWPIEVEGAGWRNGTSLEYMRRVAHAWLHDYDWRQWEARLNAIPNYHATIDGKRVHFMMERGSGSHPLPLVLTHGWPGSVVEFLDVIGPLAHPERYGEDERDAFTVIVPSLPGYAFSDPPAKPMSHRQIGQLWHRLMHESLGITDYVAQGGDVGAGVTSWLAKDHPEALRAIHLNYVILQPTLDSTAEPLDDRERAWMADNEERQVGERGYQQIQGTKFQTLAYSLTDSPVGLAAWMLEKFQGWTTPRLECDPPFDMQHLLTNVMLHWLAGPNAAMWTYPFAIDGKSHWLPAGERVAVPTGVLLGPSDLMIPPPERWIRRTYKLVQRTEAPRGGHFAALELGPAFTEEVRAFFRRFRASETAPN